ncbi:LysR substrate-binding domain-containing protein [Peptococcus simiae]|uniref:LysR substrate-binding domain-containing protein n=1 Tax=Peptococcus simiae TaxID=1643805 RepID=A0ABW9GYI4_9FIRM
MELLQYYYFNKMAEFENLSRAAEALYVSQPSLSKMLSRIENEVGFALFDRHGKSLQLNEYGKIFLTHSQQIVNHSESIQEALNQVAHTASRRLRMASSNTSLLNRWLYDFIKKAPDLGLRHTILNDNQAIMQLLSGEIDYAITLGRLAHPELTSQLLWTDSYQVVANAHSKYAHLKEVYFYELKEANFFALPQKPDFPRYIDQLARQAEFVPRIIFESEIELILEILPSLDALIVCLEQSDTFYSRLEGISAIRLLDPFAACDVFINWHKDKQHNDAGKMLLTYITEDLPHLFVKESQLGEQRLRKPRYAE